MSGTPLAFCVAGTLWDATLVAALWTVPFYSVDSGVAGQSWEVEPHES